MKGETEAVRVRHARALELMRADPELEDWQVAERLGVSQQSVATWRRKAGLTRDERGRIIPRGAR